jgi:hypothetical protein
MKSLYSMSPTEEAIRSNIMNLASQGFTTGPQQQAGMASLQNMMRTPESYMMPEYSAAMRAPVFGQTGTAARIPGMYESAMFQNMGMGTPSSPQMQSYFQKLAGPAWGNMQNELMNRAGLATQYGATSSNLADQLWQTGQSPQMANIMLGGAKGLTGALGAPAIMQAAQGAIPSLQQPYTLDLQRRLQQLGFEQGYTDIEKALWGLAQQMAGAQPIMTTTTGYTAPSWGFNFSM